MCIPKLMQSVFSFLVTFEYTWHVFQVFFADFEHVNVGWIHFCLNLYLSMRFRVGSRSPVTFKTKALCNNSQQQFPAINYFLLQTASSCVLHIVTWSMRILKGIRGILKGKGFFTSCIPLISNGLNGVNFNTLQVIMLLWLSGANSYRLLLSAAVNAAFP